MLKKTLDTPILPSSKATVAVSCKAVKTIKRLKALGIETFEITENPKLDKPVSTHADCNFLQLDKNTFICDESISVKFSEYLNKNIVNYLTIGEENIKIITEKISSPYPGEARINVKVIDNAIICNTEHISEKIHVFSSFNNTNLYHCNQGYVGCSSVLVNRNSVITDDSSVYNTFNRIGFDCLMLSKGQIKLDGYNYGFIGGCCGFIDKNLIAFNGKLSEHKDCDLIKAFLKKNNVDYIELVDGPLTDIGGILPFLEEC